VTSRFVFNFHPRCDTVPRDRSSLLVPSCRGREEFREIGPVGAILLPSQHL
jgi:hypothetical protein